LCEYINLEHVRVPVICMVNQAEYGIHIRVAASQEYVKPYSTRRVLSLKTENSNITETKKHNPNTGARTKNTIFITRLYTI